MENGAEPNLSSFSAGLEGLLHPLGLGFILYTDEANHIKP